MWQPARSLFNNLKPDRKKGWKYSVVELDGNEKLAWMPSGNEQPWLTWPVMRYSIRRRMRQLHFLPLLNRTAKIFWIQMLPSHTGNVIRGRSRTGWRSFSIKFLPTNLAAISRAKEGAAAYRNTELCQLKWFEKLKLEPTSHGTNIFCTLGFWLDSFPVYQHLFLRRYSLIFRGSQLIVTTKEMLMDDTLML